MDFYKFSAELHIILLLHQLLVLLQNYAKVSTKFFDFFLKYYKNRLKPTQIKTVFAFLWHFLVYKLSSKIIFQFFVAFFFDIFGYFLVYNCKKMPFSKPKCQKQWLILIENFMSYNISFKAPWILSSNDSFLTLLEPCHMPIMTFSRIFPNVWNIWDAGGL